LNDIATPGAANRVMTYDIFAFNDSLQATSPLFVKAEYRTQLFPNSFHVRFTVGSAHNSSGSITSVDSMISNIGSAGGGVIAPSTDRIYASGDGSYFVLAMGLTTASTYGGQISLVERLHDEYGAPTGSGFHLLSTGPNNNSISVTSQATYYNATPAQQQSRRIVHSRPSRAPAVYGGNLILGLIYPFLGKPMPPSPNILLGESTSFGLFTTTNYKIYNTTLSYIAPGTAGLNEFGNIFTNGRWIIRY
jgi:hypothetical protein